MLCREAEVATLCEMIERAVQARSGMFFVAGPPGAGKTSSVKAALQACASDKHRVVYVNGMSYSRPSKFLISLGSLLTGESFGSARTAVAGITRWQETTTVPCVLVFDEMDMLLLRRRNGTPSSLMTTTFHHLVDWSKKNLILIGISNTLNLPHCTKDCTLVFRTYTSEQIAAILASTYSLRQETLEFISKKIAEDSGDIRKAFDLATKFTLLTKPV